jgi:hypothetical protein
MQELAERCLMIYLNELKVYEIGTIEISERPGVREPRLRQRIIGQFLLKRTETSPTVNYFIENKAGLEHFIVTQKRAAVG